jgi:hypothetical protein
MRIADVYHHSQDDDLGRGLEATEDAGSAHTMKATGTRTSLNPRFIWQSLCI